MTHQEIMRLVSMGVAVVALIVAGCVAVSKDYSVNKDGGPSQLIRTLFLASKTIIALALILVAYRLSYNNWSY